MNRKLTVSIIICLVIFAASLTQAVAEDRGYEKTIDAFYNCIQNGDVEGVMDTITPETQEILKAKFSEDNKSDDDSQRELTGVLQITSLVNMKLVGVELSNIKKAQAKQLNDGKYQVNVAFHRKATVYHENKKPEIIEDDTSDDIIMVRSDGKWLIDRILPKEDE